MTLTDAQLAMRVGSIGSTDMPAIMGFYHPDLAHLSKMKNATDVWMRICHRVDLPSTSVMGRGHIVEPKLLKLFNETIMPCGPSPGTLRHPRHHWMVGSPDGVADNLLPEFKSVGRWSWNQWGEGGDLIPDGYNLQVQQLMSVTGLPRAVVLAAFGTDFKTDTGEDDFDIDRTAVYLVERDESLIEEIIKCGERFMREHVIPGISPPMKPLKNIRKWAALTKGAVNGSVANG